MVTMNNESPVGIAGMEAVIIISLSKEGVV